MSPFKTVSTAVAMSAPTSVDPVTIRIANSVYTESLVLKPYMTLEGGYHYPDWTRNISENLTIIKHPSSAPGTVTITAADESVLDGLTVEGGYFGVRVQGVRITVKNCVIKSSVIAGISASLSAQATVQSTRFDQTGNGINLASNSTLTVTDSEFLKCGQYGIFADNSVLTVEASLFDTAGQDGLYCKNSNLDLRRIQSIYHYRNGARLQSCSGRIENSIFGTSDTGLFIQNCSALEIFHNTMAGHRISALVCDQSTPDLRNNIFSGNGEYGVEERPGTVGPLRLTTNCFYGNATADYLDGGTTPTLGAPAINGGLQNGAGSVIFGNFDGDPKILAPLDDSFELGIGSSCLDAAENVAGITVDVFGRVRPFDFPLADNNGPEPDSDVGAVEFRGVSRFDFHRGPTGWVLTTLPVFFNPPEGYYVPDKLVIKSNDTLTFGFWTSPFDRIPAFPGKLYRIEWLIGTDVKNRDKVPTFRLRALHDTGKIGYTFGINSSGQGDSSPAVNDPRTYVMYFSPLQGGLQGDQLGQIVLSFDLLQFDVNDQIVSSFFIEDVKIEELDGSAFLSEFVPVTTADFSQGANGWQVLSALPAPITQPEAAQTARGLELKAVDNLFCFGSWFGPAVQTPGTQTYYVRGRVGSDATSQAAAPTFRLRLISLNNQAFCALSVNSLGDGAASPANGQQFDFETFFEAPAPAMDSGVYLFLDLLNFDPNNDPEPTVWLQFIDIRARPRP